MEQSPKIETLSPAKQELLALEAESKYIFHGTTADTDELLPQQAVDNVRGPDGDPSVFGSTISQTAIFYAIINRKNFEHESVTSGESSHVNSETTEIHSEYRVSKEDFKHLKDGAFGYVYIFNKSDFTPSEEDSPEHRRFEPIKPIKRIVVTKEDLPKNIILF